MLLILHLMMVVCVLAVVPSPIDSGQSSKRKAEVYHLYRKLYHLHHNNTPSTIFWVSPLRVPFFSASDLTDTRLNWDMHSINCSFDDEIQLLLDRVKMGFIAIFKRYFTEYLLHCIKYSVLHYDSKVIHEIIEILNLDTAFSNFYQIYLKYLYS